MNSELIPSAMGVVQWIHPSYRDLVIEQLSIDAALRTRFLEVMNLEGVKLTVSQAGGGRGDRRMPLLVSDQDWLLLSNRSQQLLENLEISKAVSMLRIFRSAMVDAAGRDRTRLSNILGVCCDTIRKRLDAAKDVIKAAQLRELFEATVLLDPLPALPQLGPTWNAATSALRATIKDADEKSFSIDAAFVDEWARLAELLTTNEPRFMRQTGYPESFARDVAELIAIIRREAAAEGGDFEDSEDLVAEAERMAILEKALKKLAEVFPSARRELSELTSIVASQEDYLRQEYRDANPYQEEGYDGGEIRSSSSQTFDIDELFSDL
jgi:hypothetical protein